MADVSVKMGVSGLSQFKSSMADAQASVKTLDAALKLNEKQLKANGNAEKTLASQATLLNEKLQKQKEIVKNAEAALRQMEQNGVKTTSKSYQDMQRRMIEARAGMIDTENAINNLGQTALDASEKTSKLESSLGGLNKKVSLEQVRSAIGSITSGMEKAAEKAVELGKQLWDTVMDSARRADDSATMAEMYGIDMDTFLRMQKLVAGGLDTSVDAILTAQTKLNKGIGSGNKQVMEYMRELGLIYDSGKGATTFITDDKIDMFWRAGQAIMAMGDAYDQEAAAQTMFGRSWKELVPLFNSYKNLDEYNEALEEQTVNNEKSIRDLAALNDAVGKLESSWTTLKDEMLGAIAPALTKGAEAVSGLLEKLTEYLKTDEGQELLEKMGKAVEGLFSDLSEIDPEQVVEGFTAVFEKVVGGLQWLFEHKGEVVDALRTIVEGWAALRLTGGALEIMKLINGVKDFQGVPTAPPSNVTGDSGVPIATGGGSGTGATGGFWSNLLNNVTLFGLANAMYEGTEGKLRKMRDDFEKATEGMTPEERNRYIMKTEFHMTDEQYNQMYSELNGENGVPVEVTPEVPENSAQEISEDIGVVPVNAELVIHKDRRTLNWTGFSPDGSNANGMPFVPFDGYMSILHRGERVLTARENRNYTYNSNTYFGNVNLNNGLEVNALAERIARNNKRKNRGFG